MTLVNTRARAIKPSETLAVKERAERLKAQGKKIINLGPGEPDIDTPEHIKEAAAKAMRDGKTKYTAVAGIPELRQALAEKLTRENKIPTEPSNVIVTNGGKQALYSLFDVTLEPGDEVIIPAPYWVSYPEMVRMSGGTPVFVPTKPEESYKLQPAVLEAAMTKRTKAVIINSASNPTGVLYSAAELKALGAVVARSNALVVSDEVYERIVFDGLQYASFAAACPELAGRVVTINALSKTYSMTGWRIGYATGPQEVIAAMVRHQNQSTSNICSIAQYAAVAAVTGSHDFLKGVVANYQRRRDLVFSLLSDNARLSPGPKPQGAFYVFIRMDGAIGGQIGATKITGSDAFMEYVLDNFGVATVPGKGFGDDGAVRISVATSDAEIEAGVRAMIEAAGRLT